MPVIDFIFFDAGGGHRSAATALKEVIELENKQWTVRLVNLQEVLDRLDVFRRVLGIRLEDVYNLMLAKGWTLGSAQGLKFMHGLIRILHKPMLKELKRHWISTQPDIVVSLVPNFNKVMYEAVNAVNPNTPYIIIITDFADYPPHFWIEEQQPKQIIVCGTTKAVQQARDVFTHDSHIWQTSGMILKPKFYEPVEVDRAMGRRRLGLDPNRTTGIVLFGGQGSSVMIDIARRLGHSKLGIQLIFICGRNEKLAAQLKALQLPMPIHVEGFTKEIPTFMHLSDFMIGKPGPGSISEAMAMGLPVIVESNMYTLPQERYNAKWVTDRGVGMVVKNFRKIDESVATLTASKNLKWCQAKTRKLDNRAVYQIVEMLQKLIDRLKIK